VATTLRAEFEERTWDLLPGRLYIAGRSADLDLSSELEMHRRVASFNVEADRWWVMNLLSGKRLTISGQGSEGAAPQVVNPNEDLVLPPGNLTVNFRIAFDVRQMTLVVPPIVRSIGLPATEAAGTATIAPAIVVGLSPKLRLLAVTLAERRLRDPSSRDPLPSAADVRARLGWSEKQYATNLDRLSEELATVGLDGVLGTATDKALRRREIAVDFLVETGVLSVDDLRLLPG
jgi:hypothetical protein